MPLKQPYDVYEKTTKAWLGTIWAMNHDAAIAAANVRWSPYAIEVRGCAFD